MTAIACAESSAEGYAVEMCSGRLQHLCPFTEYRGWENAHRSCTEYIYEMARGCRVVPFRFQK